MNSSSAALTPVNALPRAAPASGLAGVYKARPEDFQVRECLPFEPGGGGEHVYLLVCKRGLGTLELQQQIARLAGVPRHAVGYAGLKDSRAITWQWFSVHLPGREAPDWQPLETLGARVERDCRHSRKLKVGAHRGNAFRLVLRDLAGDPQLLFARCARLARRGFPNYFGEQRFGRDGGNLAGLSALGRVRPGRLNNRQKLALSAARSALFNEVLARRVLDGSWDQALPGDLVNLDGSNSFFGPLAEDEPLAERLAALEIHPTGPLPGLDRAGCTGVPAELEASVLLGQPDLMALIERCGARSARRPLRARAENLHCEELADGSLQLDFSLARGSYATALLRELGSFGQAGPGGSSTH